MNRILFTLLLLTVFAALPLASTSWVAISNRTTSSIALLVTHIPQPDGSSSEGECTVFSINTQRHLYLTAAHCLGTDLLVGGHPANILLIDEVKDVMVLQVPGFAQAALLPAPRPAKMGEEVAAFGYGYGWDQPSIKTGLISIPDFSHKSLGDRHLTILSFATILGMSGGPIINRSGRVVSMVQQGNRDGQAAIGINLASLRTVIQPYWEQ